MRASPLSSSFEFAWRERLLAAITDAGLSREAVAGELGLTKGPFYKRCAGRTAFTVDEFVWLSDRFALPRSSAELERGSLRFTPVRPPSGVFDAEAYLLGLERLRDRFVLADDSAPRARLRLLSGDIPIYWLLRYPAIAALKFYLWGWASRGHATYRRRFDLGEAREKMLPWLRRAASVAEAYGRVDAEEVWGPQPLANLLADFRLLLERRAVDETSVRQVVQDVRALIEDIRRAADDGTLGGGGTLALYRQPRHGGSPTGLLSRGGTGALFLTFDAPHHLVSDDPAARQLFADHFAAVRSYAEPVGRRARVSGRLLAEEMHASVERLSAQAQL